MKDTLLQSQYVKCNLCSADNTELLFEAKEDQFRLNGHFRIVKCKRCGLIYVNPRPNEESIAFYYPQDKYYTHRHPPKTKSLRHQVKHLIMRSYPGYDTKTERLKRLLGKIMGRFLSHQVCMIVPYKENGRILDVGCGNGEMVGWMREYGWKTYGVEISPEACELSAQQNIEVFCGKLQDAGFSSDLFDVITINQVLEHVHNPLTLLEECHRILKKDGLLLVSCPNFECFDSALFREDWFALQVPTHLYHFTKDTLRQMLSHAGFEVDKWKFKDPFPLYDHQSIRIHKENNKDISQVHLLRLILKASLLKWVKWMFSDDRGSKFSVNMTVYASKSCAGGYK